MKDRTKSTDNPNLEEQMNAEDEYLKALEDRDNKISELEQEIGNKDKALGEKDKIILQFAKSLKESGASIDAIQRDTGLSKEDISGL